MTLISGGIIQSVAAMISITVRFRIQLGQVTCPLAIKILRTTTPQAVLSIAIYITLKMLLMVITTVILRRATTLQIILTRRRIIIQWVVEIIKQHNLKVNLLLDLIMLTTLATAQTRF